MRPGSLLAMTMALSGGSAGGFDDAKDNSALKPWQQSRRRTRGKPDPDPERQAAAEAKRARKTAKRGKAATYGTTTTKEME